MGDKEQDRAEFRKMFDAMVMWYGVLGLVVAALVGVKLFFGIWS